MSGKLVVFEGTDGTGKGEMVQRTFALAVHTLGLGGVQYSKDPGGTHTGRAIRDLLFVDPTTKRMAPGVCDLLYLAAHLQNWYQVVQPALAMNRFVVHDRLWYSQMAYMKFREVPEPIRVAYESCHGPAADLLVFLHGDVEKTLERARARESETHQSAKAWDNYDTMRRIQQEYFNLFAHRPEWRAVCIDGKSVDEVWKDVRELVQPMVSEHNANLHRS